MALPRWVSDRKSSFCLSPSKQSKKKIPSKFTKRSGKGAVGLTPQESRCLSTQRLPIQRTFLEHFEVFTPETDHERLYADKRVQSWERQQNKSARRKVNKTLIRVGLPCLHFPTVGLRGAPGGFIRPFPTGVSLFYELILSIME